MLNFGKRIQGHSLSIGFIASHITSPQAPSFWPAAAVRPAPHRVIRVIQGGADLIYQSSEAYGSVSGSFPSPPPNLAHSKIKYIFNIGGPPAGTCCVERGAFFKQNKRASEIIALL